MRMNLFIKNKDKNNKTVSKTAAFIAAILVSTSLISTTAVESKAFAADGSSYVYDGYIYDFWGVAQECPAAFSPCFVIDSTSLAGGTFGSVDDVSTSKDGRIFLSDKTNGQIAVFDTNGEYIAEIHMLYNTDGSEYRDDEGKQVSLLSPTGTFFHEKNNELYVADGGNKAVFVLDGETYGVKRTIGQPENLNGVTEYIPSKVTVDKADRIYIVVQSSYEGIIELNEDGSFSRYFGVNTPKINLIQYFWKSLATDKQKEKLGKTYAPAFTNVCVDNEGFVYAVTNDLAAQDVIFRLNSAGENVIREMGMKLIGDINTEKRSQFIDIAVSEYGVYAVLDSQKGRIFVYDYDGQMLNVFGGYGNNKGQFSKPTSIAWSGYDLVVTDANLKCAYILKASDFGKAALLASEAYYNGRWDEATEYFKECIKWNANYEVAYIGIGKNCLMKDMYEDAMYYFKIGNARKYYSMAYSGYRGEKIRDYFWVIVIVFVGAMTALVYTEVRYHKKNKM